MYTYYARMHNFTSFKFIMDHCSIYCIVLRYMFQNPNDSYTTCVKVETDVASVKLRYKNSVNLPFKMFSLFY